MGVLDMADITAAEPLLTRAERYLAGAFHPIPEEQIVAKAIQSSCSWIFALLRNAFICSVLQYLADASKSMTLQILAIVAWVALAGYCFSYINMWVLTPFHFVKHRRLGVFLDGLITLAVFLALSYAVFAATRFAVNEIAQGHAASRSNPPPSATSPRS
jgi:hypothetical protein